MKSVIILLGAALATPPASQPASQPSVPPAPTAIQAITQAPDPSATIEAYARGMAANPNDVELQKAYVRHMVALGAPEMADAQAQDLVRRNVADPESMGVAAYGDAQRGQIPAAVTNLKAAVTLDPDNPFLLRTAAQVVVWYDTSPDRSMLSKDDVAGIETLRTAGNHKPEFDDAYRMAFDARQHARQEQQQEAASTQPSTTTPYIASSEPGYTSSAPTTYYYSGAPYAGGDYYPYYYPYYGYGWWAGSAIILHDHDFHHHHHFHDGFIHDDGVVRRGGGGFVFAGDGHHAVTTGDGDGIIVGHDTTFARAHRSGGTVIMGPQLLDHVDSAHGSTAAVMGPSPSASPSPAPSGRPSVAAMRQGPAPAAPSHVAGPAPRGSGGGGSSSAGGGHR